MRSMLSNRMLQLVGLCGILGFLTSAASTGDEETDLRKGAPVAPGYESITEVQAAIVTGQLKMIKNPDPMPAGVSEEKGIEYGKGGDKALLLDFYHPEKIEKNLPLLIFIHGGGWGSGNRDVYKYYTVRYAQRGYAAATISYRLTREASFPAQIEDCKAAIRFFRANAAKYHIDGEKIAVAGGSAGGHLAMLAGYTPNDDRLEGRGGNPKVSSKVQAVVNFYGPVDLTLESARDVDVVKKLMGGKTYSEASDLYKLASPIHQLDKSDPPTLIFHGTLDDIVAVKHADMLDEKLSELKIPHVYDRLKGWPHAMDLAQIVNDHCTFVMDVFLAKYLPLP